MELLNHLEFIEGLEWNLMFPVFSLVIILLSYVMLLKDVLDQKLRTTIRQEEQMDIQEKIFSSPGRTDWDPEFAPGRKIETGP